MTPKPFDESKRLGDFEILRELGRGGMGIVYEARQVSLNRKVALKVLSSSLGLTASAVVRFRREAEAAAKLHHTNIVAVHATGEDDGTHHYAMELIDGPSLNHVIAQMRRPSAPPADEGEPQNPPADGEATVSVALPGWVADTLSGDVAPPSDSTTGSTTTAIGDSSSTLHSGKSYFDNVARTIAEVADALDYAHNQGVIHRDIKPSNLLLSPDGRLSVTDFGLARVLEQPGVTMTGEFVGSPLYMSPEQIAAGRMQIDHRTDIYSLGATLYELLTLQPPFPGDRRDQIVAQILTRDPTRPRGHDRKIPVDLETICLKALEKDPNQRYQTGSALAEDLRRYLSRDAISARRIGPVRRLGKFARRHKTPVAAAVGVALAASIGVALAWKYWPEPPAPRLTLTGQEQLTSDPGLTTEPTLSRDGQWMASASDRGGNDNLDIWVRPVAGGEPRQLTSHPADDREPAIAPDGRTIVFRSERDGGGLYIMPVATGEKSTPARFLAPLGRRPRFSPDGTFVAYWVGVRAAGVPSRSGKVFVVRAAGGSSTQLQSHFSSARCPIWSPDGEHVLFRGFGTRSPTGSADTPEWDWWLAPVDGGAARRTGAIDAFRRHGVSGSPVPGTWIPRKNRVVFSGTSGDTEKLWSLPLSPETGTVTGALQQLTRGAGRELQPWATKDGRVVFVSLISNTDVWSLPIRANDGVVTGEPERLTHNPAFDAGPFLSDEGTRMVFDSDRLGSRDVWLKDLQTGVETLLVDERDALWSEWHPILTANGLKVACSSYGPGGRRIVVRAVDGSEPEEKVLDRAAHPWDWSSDGKEILYWPGAHPAPVAVRDLTSGEPATILQDPVYDLYQAYFDPDDRWIAFLAASGTAEPPSQLWIARYRGHVPIERNEWIPVPQGGEIDDKPRWSPDGNLLYFISDRDGFRCIWAQPLDPGTKRPIGAARAVKHFHTARLSMSGVNLARQEISVALDRMALCLDERTGNIWMAELTEE